MFLGCWGPHSRFVRFPRALVARRAAAPRPLHGSEHNTISALDRVKGRAALIAFSCFSLNTRIHNLFVKFQTVFVMF